MVDFSMFVDLLRSDGSIVVNKNMMRVLGLAATVTYAELLARWVYFWKRDELTDDGFFYNTAEDLAFATSLSRYQQAEAIKVLVSAGLLEQKNIGMPAKRHFKIIQNAEKIKEIIEKGRKQDFKKLESKLSKNLKTSFQKTEKQVFKKFELNNTKRIILTNNTKNNIHTLSGTGEDLAKPLAKTKQQKICQEVIDYLNEKAQTKYRATTAKTRSLIHARLSEGFALNDFKTVIDKKCAEWKGTEFEKFLRPETLFGTKFEGYLNARQTVQKSTNKNADLYARALAKAREIDERQS